MREMSKIISEFIEEAVKADARVYEDIKNDAYKHTVGHPDVQECFNILFDVVNRKREENVA